MHSASGQVPRDQSQVSVSLCYYHCIGFGSEGDPYTTNFFHEQRYTTCSAISWIIGTPHFVRSAREKSLEIPRDRESNPGHSHDRSGAERVSYYTVLSWLTNNEKLSKLSFTGEQAMYPFPHSLWSHPLKRSTLPANYAEGPTSRNLYVEYLKFGNRIFSPSPWSGKYITQ